MEKNIIKMSNREFDSWLWKWFKGWAIATVFIIITTTHCHAAFTLGSKWETTGSGQQQGTVAGSYYGSFGTGFWSMFARWMY